MSKTAIIVTTINPPTQALLSLSQGAEAKGWRLIVIGDTATPGDFILPYGEYFSVERQRATGLALAEVAPTKNYARKNIGYLIAIQGGATTIIETDDDNFPRPEFWQNRKLRIEARSIVGEGWQNVYRTFSDRNIWPRGLPLSQIRQVPEVKPDLTFVDAPVQQGLADGDPDVDAIFRLVLQSEEFVFDDCPPVSLVESCWCPINSQNTTWFPAAYPTLYIPFTCTMRACDIWRGLVAQPWVWRLGGRTSFHRASMHQNRNVHDLIRDFDDEIPVYLGASRFPELLPAVDICDPSAYLQSYYRNLIDAGLVEQEEQTFLDAWLKDLYSICAAPQ